MSERRSPIEKLRAQLLRDLQSRHQRVRRGLVKAATATARIIRSERVPVAFGELRDGIRPELTAKGARIVSDAPHAEPVEVGSRPHWPPLDPLIAWVKLRASQGLLTPRQRVRLPGTTTIRHAESVAEQMRKLEHGGALPVDAPVQIARAIQRAIAARGTKPHWYMRDSLPIAMRELDAAIKEALS